MVVDEGEIVEQQVVSGIAYSRDEAKITLLRVADRPGVAAAIFGPLADHAINVDMIVQNVSEDGRTTDLTFTLPKADLDREQKLNTQHTVIYAEAKLAVPKSELSLPGTVEAFQQASIFARTTGLHELIPQPWEQEAITRARKCGGQPEEAA